MIIYARATTTLIFSMVCACPGEQADTHAFRADFLKFCDLAAAELNKEITPFLSRTNADPETHHMPFFEDAHAVRALGVAYDMTGKREYLDASRRWSERIVKFQKSMIPAGAYYMNHSRAPGQAEGQWNVADSGSIAMGVLATASRCKGQERERFLRSAKAFAHLVLENYVGPEGGIANGLWPQHSGEWWCSTATFGTFLFLLYEETGEDKYLHAAKRACEWLAKTDFREVKPITFEQRPSGIIYYCFEFYAAALKHFSATAPTYGSIVRQFKSALDWMAKNQKTRGADVPDYTERNVDMAGLPCVMHAFARQVPQFRHAFAPADAELRYVGDLLLAKGDPEISRLMVWEVMTWGMQSYAERLAPGALHSKAIAATSLGDSTIIDFERKLKQMRFQRYQFPDTDIIKSGFRPVGGQIADFAVARHNGRDHFFYIERRLQEGTPFYPGHENFFGHASTTNFFNWEVHDPVLLVRPGTWEEAHVWAPVIISQGDDFIMAYTGLNRHLSQNIGLASSKDLFEWRRWNCNPISPCKNAAWAYWRHDDICSCRDPDLVRNRGRIYMPYTANTREGATCIALASTTDFRQWKDHGPIIMGPASGYEPHLNGGHPQASFESPNLSFRNGRWFLVFHAAIRGKGRATWAAASHRVDSFDTNKLWEFWSEGTCTEVVRNDGDRSLIAGVINGKLRFAEVDWNPAQPTAKTIADAPTLAAWHSK